MRLISFLSVFIFCSTSVFAATILQTKNNRILMALDGEKAKVGQVITLLDTDGKTVATATINQVKGGKAIATLKTGKVDGSETIQFPGAAVKSDDSEEVAEDSFSKRTQNVYRLNATKISVLLNLAMNNMTAEVSDSSITPNLEQVAMKGTSIGLSAALDYPLLNWMIFRGTLGYEPFSVTGTGQFNSCDNKTSPNCNANISYLAAGGFARFNLSKSKTQWWAGVGAVAKFPISKASTALIVDQLKLTTTFGAAFGVDYFLSNKTFVPVSLDYQMFIPSETVTGNMITIRGGYGWAF